MTTKSSAPVVRLFFALLLVVGAALLSASTAAANTAACNTYANDAIADVKKAHRWGCLNFFQGGSFQWDKRHGIHKRWCQETVKRTKHLAWSVILLNETKKRRKQLAACVAKKCNDYARKALAHHAAARRFGCTKLARYWQTNHQAHVNFCKGTTYQNVQATLKRRDKRLHGCRLQTQTCAKYAKAAVAAAKRARQYRCLNLIQKARHEWSLVFAMHDRWCQGVPPKERDQRLRREAHNRETQIKACIHRYCNDYAKKALAHYAGARAAGCTKLARYWQTNQQAHVNFCKGTTSQNVEATLKRRDQKLRLCRHQAANKIRHYLGCYRDTPQRTFPVSRGRHGSAFICGRLCKKGGYKYAALQHGGQCFCGNTLPTRNKYPLQRCRMRCPRDPGRMCGGHWANSVYLLK